MKRTNVIVDGKLLEEAKRLSGEPTNSATINHALRELVRTIKIDEGLRILGGSHAWQGNLDEMRRDRRFDPVTESAATMIRDTPVADDRKRKKKRGSRR